MIVKSLAQLLFAASAAYLMPLDGAVLEWQAGRDLAQDVLARSVSAAEIPHLPLAGNRYAPPPKKVNMDSFGVVTSSQSVLVLDAASGVPLFVKNPQEQRAMGSITKLMSAIVFLETNPDLSRFVTLTDDDFAGTGRVYLYYDDPVRLRDILGAAIVGSDNTAISSLARFAELTEDEFVARMNARARELGMQNTSFADLTGLSAHNTSTVGDIAIMLRAAQSHEELQGFMTTATLTVAHASGRTSTIPSTNLLLTSFVNEGEYSVTGGKTGYIPQAGYCLATAVSRNGDELLIVVLGSPEFHGRFDDAEALATWAFSTFSWENL